MLNVVACVSVIKSDDILFPDSRPRASHGQDAAAPDRVHESAAAGTGEPVPDEQVPLPTQALRSRHQPHVDRDSGK